MNYIIKTLITVALVLSYVLANDEGVVRAQLAPIIKCKDCGERGDKKKKEEKTTKEKVPKYVSRCKKEASKKKVKESNKASKDRCIDLIVIHATGGPTCKCEVKVEEGKKCPVDKEYYIRIPTYKKVKNIKSNIKKGYGYHYVIGKNGFPYVWEAEEVEVNHAYGHNPYSIGIALVNDGDGEDKVTPAQWSRLVAMLKNLLKTYDLQPTDVMSHSQIDKRYFKCAGKKYKFKIDPGGEDGASSGNFDWAKLRKEIARK